MLCVFLRLLLSLCEFERNVSFPQNLRNSLIANLENSILLFLENLMQEGLVLTFLILAASL